MNPQEIVKKQLDFYNNHIKKAVTIYKIENNLIKESLVCI
jgi:hypothetical protein